jgi:hypothetical protein
MSVKCLHQQKASKGGSMSRISLKQDHELDEATLKNVKAIEAAGGDASLARGLAHCQPFFNDYFQFYGPARKGRSIDEALIELVRLKVARANNCFT